MDFKQDLKDLKFWPLLVVRFLTAKEAVQQSIRSICVSVCLFVCATLEILLLKGSNQQIRAQTETN